jgi:hypothetical protein
MKKNKKEKERHALFIDKIGMALPAPRGALCLPVTYFACGREMCRDGQPHQWDGIPIEDEHMSAATCSKCGLDAMSHSLMCGP